MAAHKKSNTIIKLFKIVLCTFLVLTFGLIFLYHTARYYFSIPHNPNNQPLVQPVYKELYVGSMWNVKPDPHGILAFMEKSSNPTKMIIFDVSQARIVSTKVTSILEDVSGPYWENNARVTFPAFMDKSGGNCTNMYVSQAPDWRFTIEPCNPIWEGKTNSSDFINIPTRKTGVTLPSGSDTRGVTQDLIWRIIDDPIISPQGDLYAIQVGDRFHKTFNEGNFYISDVRLVDKKGCTVAQIGSIDKYGTPEVQPIGWTDNGDLVVYRQGWLKDRQMGLFLVSKAEIEKMKNSSRCYR